MTSIPPTVRVNGITWNLFSVDFNTADGKFSTYIYAISREHAEAILFDIKDTAVIGGQIMGVVK